MTDIYTPPDSNIKYKYRKGETCRGFQLIHKWILLSGKYPELVEKIHELIEADPAVVNLKLKNGMMPLHLVCSDVGELDRVAMAKMLLEKGATIDAKYEFQRTPLHWAAIYGHADVAKLLLEKGANVNAEDKDQRTPLHWAVYKYHADVARLLLEKGANVNAEDNDQQTPLHWAADCDNADVAKLLLEKGANVDAEDENQQTPLHQAAVRGHVDVTKVLLENGANVNEEDKNQQTPLHWAAKIDHADVAKVLLKKGANVDATDEYQRTPLFWAADKGHPDMAKLLLEKGANATLVGENKIISYVLLSIENDKKTNGLAQIGKILKEMYGLETKNQMDIIQTIKDMLEFSPEHPNVDQIGSHFKKLISE